MSDQVHVSIPSITLKCEDLPSRGVCYPAGSVIKYKTYTHGEMRKFSIQNSSPALSLEMAVTGLEINNFDPLKLSVLDAFYIGLLRKTSTMSGMQVEVPYLCNECGGTGKQVFTSSDIEFENLSEEVKALPITATLAGKEVVFNLMTVKDFMDMDRGKYNKDIPGGKPDALTVEALMIQNMKFGDAYKMLYNLDNEEDIEVLEEIDQILQHDIKPVKATCSLINKETNQVCNHVNMIKLEGREALIRPFRGGERSPRTRIRFGSESNS